MQAWVSVGMFLGLRYHRAAMTMVNPDILVWARETAGLTPADAVKKLGIPDARGVDAVSRLIALESGEAEPTRPMLVKMADKYRRPLLTFYLSSPPRKGDRGADFRALPGEGRAPASEALVDALIRNVRARQGMVRAALEEEEEAQPLAFVGSMSIEDGQGAVLKALRELLSVDLQEYRNQPDAASAFNLLRRRAGAAGVFVLLKGDLGNYHSALDVEVFRGFSLADEVAPFVALNDRDAKSAWSFTLLHELVHLLLGQTGVSGEYGGNEVEMFCDGVAGEFLLPWPEVTGAGISDGMAIEAAADRIADFAKARKVSHSMVAYKAYRAGMIGRDYFGRLAARFRGNWRSDRVRQREENREVNYYIVKRHRIGDELMNFARRMMGVGALTTLKAARILGVKPAKVHDLLAEQR